MFPMIRSDQNFCNPFFLIHVHHVPPALVIMNSTPSFCTTPQSTTPSFCKQTFVNGKVASLENIAVASLRQISSAAKLKKCRAGKYVYIAWKEGEVYEAIKRMIHFISKPRISDAWAWHIGALLALCDTKGSRQDFPLLQVGKQGLIKASTPDHSGCKFVHLGPPGILWASLALRLFSNPGPKGLTRKHALPPHISGGQSCNLSKKH